MAQGLELLLAAGQAALRETRWADAGDAFSAAMAIEPVGEALAGLADASWWLGHLDESVARREEAFAWFRERGDVFQASYAALLLCGDQHKQYGDPIAAGAWLRRARRLIEDNELADLRGWLLLFTAFTGTDPVRVETAAREAHAFAVEAGDHDLELCALSQIGVGLVGQGRVQEGVPYLEEAVTVALTPGSNPDTVVFTSCMMMTSCSVSAQFARAAHCVRATMAFTEEVGCPFLYAECRILYGRVLVATGDWDRAEQELVAGLEMTRNAVPALHRLALATLAELWIGQGKLEEAERLLAGHEDQAQTAAVVALLHLRRGRPAAAAAVAHRQLRALGEHRFDSGRFIELLGEAALVTGDHDEAAANGRALAEFGSSAGSELLEALGARLKAQAAAGLGDGSSARRLLDAAIIGFAQLEMPYEAARTRALLARQVAPWEPEVATAEARAGLAVFESLGANPDADAAAALLRGLGVPVVRSGPRGHAGLTKREHEVLGLLGEGLSNPEIATRLHLSRKTVEHHVAHVLAKLGLRSRAQAAAEAVRTGTESAMK